MALSEVTRKQARSDVYLRIDEVGSTDLIDDEINLWLDRGQYDFFNRMSSLVEKWYGKNETISSISPSNGAVTQVALTGNYAATKIAKIVKFVHADGTTIWHPTEFGKLEHMLGNSTYDSHYAYAWFGENLHVFVGTSAGSISSNASVLHFIRKPTALGGDTNVFTITVSDYSSIAANATITIDGVEFIEKQSSTPEVADWKQETGNTETAANINDVIDAVFSSTSNITTSDSTGTVTVTGAKTVTSSDSTRLTVAASTAAMLDVPSEYVDLPIMYAQARALGKFNSMAEMAVVERELEGRYSAIHALYGEAIQLKALEERAGIQTPRVE